MNYPRIISAVTILMGVALGGCETASTTSASSETTPIGSSEASKPTRRAKGEVVLIPTEKVNAIHKGLPAADVVQLLGEPTEKKPFPAAGVQAEVWTYRISMVETVTMVATSTREIPGFDPLGQGHVTIQQPVYQNQFIRVYQTLELLVVEGILTERKPGREVERSFN